ncbi:uncharacterized protein LOC125421521 [Ziziphus jujuba]|uniref:Uncharacterized protein LOC125421521 n=1 Tax=Ziziphus jujuba TaxID=326968 RepID=A0ABM3IEL7_ZIZJJ|nr:uncharacterized protein LOC125421521 [Ziziphus jujuba]
MGVIPIPSSGIVPQVLKNNLENLKEWSIRLRTYLMTQDVWDVMEPTPTFVDVRDVAVEMAWKRKNATALHAIYISCGPRAFSAIQYIPEAKGGWDKLAELEPQPKLEIAERILSRNDGTEQYKELYKAVRKGDLSKINQFITENPDAVSANITCTKRTALHVAAMVGHLSIVKMLVQKMPKEDLVLLTDEDGFTALAAAITCNAKQSIAECMVHKNKELLKTKAYGMLPAALAFRYCHKKMGRYLYTITPPDYLLQHRPESATIICNAIYAHSFDVASDLLSKCKELAVTPDKDGVRLVYALANHPSAFKSGRRLKFWQECLHRCIRIDSTFPIKSGIKDVYDMKKVHIQNLKFICCMANMIQDLDLNLDQMEEHCINEALFQAVERGNVEFVKSMLKANPDLVETLDQSYRNIFMLAIQFRQPKIFSLIYNSNSKLSATSALDIQKNNMLHSAAYLAPPDVLNSIPGAALQLQNELQWFQEVMSIVPPWALHHRNNQGMTPGEIFNQEHKELVPQGEKWMKDTAKSYTAVGALIVTITFAAASTVPGGNLDSGYLQEDFLVSLPRRLMIGLFALFFSIVSMMVAFSATLLIVFGDNYPWISIPVTCLASIPVTLFVFLQFPLLADIFSSTCGRGMFDKKVRI